MTHLSDRINRLSESQTIAMARRSRELIAQGIDIISLSLGEPDFKTLINSCDGYILQVHSFDRPAPGQRPVVCDPVKTRAWVQQASALGRPFAVALPTYRTTAG